MNNSATTRCVGSVWRMEIRAVSATHDETAAIFKLLSFGTTTAAVVVAETNAMGKGRVSYPYILIHHNTTLQRNSTDLS